MCFLGPSSFKGAQEAYDSGATTYQGYDMRQRQQGEGMFTGWGNGNTSKTILFQNAPKSSVQSTDAPAVKNVDGTKTYGSVANAFTQPQSGGATRMIS